MLVETDTPIESMSETSYQNRLDAFCKMVKQQYRTFIKGIDDKVVSVEVRAASGYKYDKIVIEVERTYVKSQVKYFIERTSGKIYGAKSANSVNMTRFFGLIENASKWNWGGESPKNELDSTVIPKRTYGDVILYRSIDTTA